MTVGYGNHEAPGSGQAPSKDGGKDRPGMDLGGAGDKSAASGAGAGSRSTPNPAGQGPHTQQGDAPSPVLTDANTDETRAPGSGAFPTNPQNGETDPATD